MADYRTTDTVVVKRRGAGSTIAIILLVLAIIVGILFYTGFWSANVTKTGALPEVSVKGGALPSVDLDSKKVVVGTTKKTIDVPKVETEKKTIDVPVVGVSEGDKK